MPADDRSAAGARSSSAQNLMGASPSARNLLLGRGEAGEVRLPRWAKAGAVVGLLALVCVAAVGLAHFNGSLENLPGKEEVCGSMAMDVAYLYARPPPNTVSQVAAAGDCCKHCQGVASCLSWTWVKDSGDCYLQDVMPERNISKAGFWSGTVQARAPVTAATTAPAAKSTTQPTPTQPAPTTTAPLPVTTAPVPAPTPTAAPVPGAQRPVAGGEAARAVFEGFLGVWRGTYQENDGSVPEVPNAGLPRALQNVRTKIVVSSGGAAGGVVTEGMGYGIMVEAFKAAQGDEEGLANGLALLRGWLGMVYGPDSTPHPFGGGTPEQGATNASSAPYGVSAIAGRGGEAASGVAAWKYPISQCSPKCQGSATDGDEDAVLGMIYLAAALNYPADFTDMVMRAVVAFASADLGFPDLYRTLPDERKVFVPKGGSQWGGLLPEQGKYKSSQEPWCYNPSYFAPGHYRTFRDFVQRRWQPSFSTYLPQHLDGKPSSATELASAFEGAVVGGYNILYHSSCSSGAVGNWVGVKAECEDPTALSCPGVPWATTPYVGKAGTCTASGTTFGSYGPDASRTPWRIAMDYVLHTEESLHVPMYDQSGKADAALVFNAQTYLNGMANQYRGHAQCDGAKGDCKAAGSDQTASFKLASAFDATAPQTTCHNVPNAMQSWWAPFMAWPTFTAFVAPLPELSHQDSAAWLDTFASICEFTGGAPKGTICSSSYFELGQEVISSMVMAGGVPPLPERQTGFLFKK